MSRNLTVLAVAVLLVFTGLAIMASTGSNEPQEDGNDRLRAHISTQAENLLSEMTLREKIAQLIIIRANGSYYADDHDEFRHLARMVEEYQVGGIIFFRGDVYNQAVLNNNLQQRSRIPLWISQDMEFGAAMRVGGTTRITPAMGVAATGNPHWAFEKGRITAMEARAIGVHQIYAPVVDVNNNPDNPVINVRSFSEDPETVSMFAESFIKGVQSQGLISTAKHFPGHGDTDTDSHTALPTITRSYENLSEVELIPFKRVIDAGVESVMSAHISFPNIASDPATPATLDGRLLNGILRDSLGFNGLIVTDGLEMQGIAAHYAPGEAAVLALNAGSDLLLLSPDELTAIFQIEEAVQRGEITEERIDESVMRLLTHKINHGLMRRADVNINRISRLVNTRQNQMIADQIARESITVVRNNRDILPIRPDRYPNITVIAIANSQSGTVGSGFRTALNQYHPSISFHLYDDRTSREELDQAVASARSADLVIIGSFLPLTTGQPITFKRAQRQFVDRLTALNKPTAVVSFSSPYVISEVPDADVHALAWTSLGSHSEAAAAALFGATEVNGRLPITIPGLYERGEGIHLPKTILRRDYPETAGLSAERLYEVNRIMNRAVQDSVFPGGVVAVVKDGVLAYQEAFGYHDYNKRRPVRTNDIYDLASLTKPVATTTAIQMLVDEGIIGLDDKVSQYFDEFSRDNKEAITIRMLLNHTSGLPAFRTYVDRHRTKATILNAILNEPLINQPGETIVYSDLGFILLAEIAERVSGQSFDQFLNRRVYYPMGMSDTVFNPQRRGRWTVNRIPPTEVDEQYRNTRIRAEVHDERAFYMGGIAGHAGLFSTASDMAKFTQMLIQQGEYNGRRFINEETLQYFTERREEQMGRALGYDLKSLEGFTTAGNLSSDDTFGHLGFTGTSFWIDPERKLSVVILTNRTYPKRGTATGINRVRSAVMDAVIESVID